MNKLVRGTKVLLDIKGMTEEVFEILLYDDINNKIFVRDKRLPLILDARRIIRIL